MDGLIDGLIALLLLPASASLPTRAGICPMAPWSLFPAFLCLSLVLPDLT